MKFPTKYDPKRHGNRWLSVIPQGFHPGIDFNFGFGSDDEGQDVIAIADGIVKHAKLCKGWGNHVIIYHPEYKIWSHYAHLKDYCVKVADEVKEEQLIGHLGTTGNSTAPHLHFEIRLIDIPSEKYVTGLTIEDVQKRYANPEDWIKDKIKNPRVPSIVINTVSQNFLFTRDLFFGCSGDDVKKLQQLLNTDLDTQLAVKGIGSPGQESDYFGRLTKQAVQNFQTKYNVVSVGSDNYGKVELSTREKLQELFGDKKPNSDEKATIQQMAQKYDLDVASILAVAQVESGGRTGFQKTGELTVLFEAHIFYRELKKAGLNPDVLIVQYPNLISPKWNRKLYKGGDAENIRLAEALKIHECAWNCASYGMFQIMGFNHKICSFANAQDFVKYLKTGQEAHIDTFFKFVSANPKMMNALRAHDWPTFARLYNGPGYAQNKYDIKLAEAYKTQNARS